MEAYDYEKTLVLYVGTKKIVALEGLIQPKDVQILHYAKENYPEGFKSGFVSNLERASASLQKLLDQLYRGHLPEDVSAYVVLGNPHLKSYSFSSCQYYHGDTRNITSHEIRSVIHQTRTVATLPLNEQVLQAFPESFMVNDLSEVKNPMGLEARRLGVNLKIFTMNFQDFKNISRAFEMADIGVNGYFPKTLAVSEAILTPEERHHGVLVLDMADDATQLILWKNDSLAGTKTIPLGGKALTQQIAGQWGIEFHDAERMKERYGSLSFDDKFGEELIPLVERHGVGSHPIRRYEFQDVFFQLTYDWLAKILTQADQFAAENKIHYPHFVFTGGGTAIDGLIEFLQRRFSRVARVGLTKKMDAPNELLADPAMSGALGMFRWLVQNDREYRMMLEPTSVIHRTLATARDWFMSYF